MSKSTRQQRLSESNLQEQPLPEQEQPEQEQPELEDANQLNFDEPLPNAADIAAADWERAEKSEGQELTGIMLTQKVFDGFSNKTQVFLFTGFGEIADIQTGEMRRAALLTNKAKEAFICPAAMVVSTLERIPENEIPCFIKMINEGTKEGKHNKYWNVRIIKL